jgi:hypothetical protein
MYFTYWCHNRIHKASIIIVVHFLLYVRKSLSDTCTSSVCIMWCVGIWIALYTGLGSVLLCLLSLGVMVLCCRLHRLKLASLQKDGMSTSDPPSIFDHTGFMTHKGRINWVTNCHVFKCPTPSSQFEMYDWRCTRATSVRIWTVRVWLQTDSALWFLDGPIIE